MEQWPFSSEENSSSQEKLTLYEVTEKLGNSFENSQTATDIEGALDLYCGTGEGAREMVLGEDYVSELQVSQMYDLVDALRPESSWTEEHSSTLETYKTLFPKFSDAIERVLAKKV